MSFKEPTDLERAIATSAQAERAPTAEELRLATASPAQLLREKTGDVGAGVDPQLALKRQLGRYHQLTRPKMSPTKVYNCRSLLEKGEDPFMLALYFNADFGAVAGIANDILRVKEERLGRPLGRIPTTVFAYLQLAQKLQDEAAALANEDAPAAEIDAASADVPEKLKPAGTFPAPFPAALGA